MRPFNLALSPDLRYTSTEVSVSQFLELKKKVSQKCGWCLSCFFSLQLAWVDFNVTLIHGSAIDFLIIPAYSLSTLITTSSLKNKLDSHHSVTHMYHQVTMNLNLHYYTIKPKFEKGGPVSNAPLLIHQASDIRVAPVGTRNPSTLQNSPQVPLGG